MYRQNSTSVDWLLETYQQCRKRGEWARIVLETKHGHEFATLSVNLPNGPVRKYLTGFVNRKPPFAKTKSPSRQRRDRERMERFRMARPSKLTQEVSDKQSSDGMKSPEKVPNILLDDFFLIYETQANTSKSKTN